MQVECPLTHSPLTGGCPRTECMYNRSGLGLRNDCIAISSPSVLDKPASEYLLSHIFPNLSDEERSKEIRRTTKAIHRSALLLGYMNNVDKTQLQGRVTEKFIRVTRSLRFPPFNLQVLPWSYGMLHRILFHPSYESYLSRMEPNLTVAKSLLMTDHALSQLRSDLEGEFQPGK